MNPWPSRWKQLYKDLERRQVADSRSASQKIKMLANPGDFASQINKAGKFLFECEYQHNEEVMASKQLMQERDLWRLPFPVTLIEFPAELCCEDAKIISHVVLLCSTPDTWQVFIKDIRGSKHWCLLLDSQRHSPDRDVSFDSFQKTIDTFLVLLHTKGVQRRRELNGHAVLVGRDMPRDGYTRVTLTASPASPSDEAVSPSLRHRVRLHLRRGHIRNQRFGPGRTLVTEIYIQPTLVGYEDEGKIEQQYVIGTQQ